MYTDIRHYKVSIPLYSFTIFKYVGYTVKTLKSLWLDLFIYTLMHKTLQSCTNVQ